MEAVGGLETEIVEVEHGRERIKPLVNMAW